MMSSERNSDTSPNDVKFLNRKLYSSTIRITVPLREPDEESCSVFDYISLTAEEKINRREEKEKFLCNGSFDNSQHEEEAKRLAQQFEAKYGSGCKPKKKKKAPTFYNYSELAAGYDESDSFIDNSEALDEALPDEMETFHGGYYVNCGQLEFKKVDTVDDNSDFEEIRTGKKKTAILHSEDSDEEEASMSVKAVNKPQVVEELEPIKKQSDPNEKVVSIETKVEKLKRKKLKRTGSPSINGDLVSKKRKYKKRRTMADAALEEELKVKKKMITVKTMLEEKRTTVENIIEQLFDTDGETTNGLIIQPVKSAKVCNSINDVIESVVNAARDRSEDSRDSTASSSDTKSIDSRTSYETEKESRTDEMEVDGGRQVAARLPDELPDDVLELVTQIKNSARHSDLGARTFFNPYINAKLLSLEAKVRPLASNCRHQLYDHLANFLPCSKDTLMKRAKKLLIEEEEKFMTEPFTKLKASIDKIMPSLMDNYTIACQLVAEEKNIGDIKNGEMDDKKSLLFSKMPQKKFVWSDETKGYLRELVSCRLKCFYMLKPRKESSDEYVKKFLDTKVKPLWPHGWMDTSILWKEAHVSSLTHRTRKVSGTSVVDRKKTESSAAESHVYHAPTVDVLSHIAHSGQYASVSASISHKDRRTEASVHKPEKDLVTVSPIPASPISASPISASPISASPISASPVPAAVPMANNESFKIDALIGPSKGREQPHMLNHISQYNKHYSHSKEEKRRHEGEKTDHILDLSPSKKESNYWARCEEVLEKELPHTTTNMDASNHVPIPVSSPRPTHISRKQRILQESAKNAANESMKSAAQALINLHESIPQFNMESHPTTSLQITPIPLIEDKPQLPDEKDSIEETTTATDILSKIINDTLQDNSTPLQPQFTNSLFDDLKKEPRTEEPVSSVEEWQTSPADRRTPMGDRAELDVTDVINDLLALNQMGVAKNRFNDKSASPEFNSRNVAQSSPHSTDSSKSSSSLPRMNLAGFQDEFFKHIYKREYSGASTYNNDWKSDNGYSHEYNPIKNNPSPGLSHNVPSTSPVNRGNGQYQYQSVIMPPSSNKWYLPVDLPHSGISHNDQAAGLASVTGSEFMINQQIMSATAIIRNLSNHVGSIAW